MLYTLPLVSTLMPPRWATPVRFRTLLPARKLGVDVPKAPTASEQWELRIASSLKGRAFNRWYSSLEVFDHIQDIAEAKDEVQDGKLASARKESKQEIPMLRLHEKLAQQALRASR